MRRRVAAYVTLNAVCVAIWLATGAHGGFWPAWVMLGTGIGLFAMIVRTLFGVPHEEDDERGPPARPSPPRLP